MSPHVRLGLAASAIALLTAACGGTTTGATDDVRVVATTSVMGDLVSGLTNCAGGTTDTLMPAGTDPHEFAASSRDVADLAKADLVVANGLHLEEGLVDTLEGLESDGVAILEVAPLLDPLPLAEHEHKHEHEHEHGEHDEHDEGAGHDEHGEDHHAHDHGSQDPHVWHDPQRMAKAAELVGDELAERTGNDDFSRCGTEEHDRLMDLDTQVREILATVPPQRRVLVTDHDAFRYFATAFDFEIAGTVIPSPSTLAEPSSSALADLVSVVESAGVSAIFSNSAANPSLVESVAAEAGADVSVVKLYVDSLGPKGSGADTYAGMMTTNAHSIADALSGDAAP
jgi:zinc/manganese transport system substrate-binding protein